ncbi:MAG: hypothetical protein IKH04_01075 [Kiritimatiellae bacterium]|nr:hypothetical protein [Kiritimatiellia bacterium]
MKFTSTIVASFAPLLVALSTSFAQTPATWDCDPVAWRENGETLEAIGSGFALAPCAKGRKAEITARVTPVSTECPEYATIGLAVFDDLEHFWKLSLVKKPESRGGGTFCEMKCQSGGTWADEIDGFRRVANEGRGDWKWGRTYEMTLSLSPEAVEGAIRDAETGALVRRFRLENTGSAAPFAGRPAVSATGDLRGRAEVVRLSVGDEVPDTWRVFPEYRPVGLDTGVHGMATGFFHVESIGGVEWAVDPVGRGVILAGTDWCNPRGSYSQKRGYNPYERFVKAHYPSTEAWAAETASRLRDWGFTCLPCGGDESLYYKTLAHANAADRLYFSHRLCLGTADPDWRIAEYRRSPCTALPNVFHPQFEAACDWWARQRCAGCKDDPWLLGYFIDNELAWWGEVSENKAGGVFDLVAGKPASHPAKRALLRFLSERFNAPADAGLIRRAGPEDKRAFLRLVADRYFAVTTGAIRRADPNHMILGCRFAGGPKGVDPVVLETAGKYCDIVSFNHYPWADLDRNVVQQSKADPTRVLDLYREAHDIAKRPLFQTEWSFPALDTGRPCTYGAGQRFHTQAERVQATELYAKTLLSLPFIVGYSYFRWLDQPAEGISKYFPENTNYGLVSEEGVPYRELTEMFARVQGDALRWHGAPPPEERESQSAPEPSEREQYLAAARPVPGAARPVPGAEAPGPVAFSRDGDAWVLSNSLVRLSGRVGGKYMADEIAYRPDGDPLAGPRPVGRWGALLQGASDNIPYWVDVSRVTDVSFSRDGATGVVTATIRAEGGGGREVAGGSAPSALGFAFTHRLSLAPGTLDILAEIVSLENTGSAPIDVRCIFMRPFAVQRDPVEFRSVPNLWKGPVEGFWLLSDGSRWGVSTRDSRVLKATLWRKDGETAQHPDVRCMEGNPFVLAPGATYRPTSPIGARIKFLPPDPNADNGPVSSYSVLGQ